MSRYCRWLTQTIRLASRAYPRDFRDQLGEDLVVIFARECERTNKGRGRMAAFRYTVRTLAGVLMDVVSQRTSGRFAKSSSPPPPPRPRSHMFDHLRLNLRYTARMMSRRPGFTGVVVITLALGIGANTAMFSIVNAVLLEPLPYAKADRLVALGHRAPGLGSVDRWGISQANYFYYRSEIGGFEDLGAFFAVELAFAGPGDVARLRVVAATSTLFSTLGARAAAGRLLTVEDDAFDGARVAVLSHDVWTRQFGADPAVIGSMIRVNGFPREIVGVATPGFHLPDRKVDVWVPLRLNPNATPNNSHSFSAIARLSETATLSDTRAELAQHVERFPETLPTAYSASFMRNARFTAEVESLREDVVGDISSMLWIILGSVSLVLLIACANVANLLLVRAESRRREIALRAALGASRHDLARHLLAESMALAMAGGAVGLAFSGGGLGVLLTAAPESLPRLETVGIDGKTLAFALALSVTTGLVFGILPLLRRRPDAPSEALNTGTRGVGAASGHHHTRKLLVVGQVAMALVLLVAAGLMARSFQQLRNVDPGFDPNGALVFDVALPAYEFRDHDAVYGFHREFLTRLEQLSGVEHAGGVSVMPLEEGVTCYSFSVRDRAADTQATPCVPVRWVAPGYFAAMRIPLTAGRAFELRDNDLRNGAVVLSHVLAEQMWPGEDPIGKEVRIFGAREPWYRVVGVANPVRSEGLESPPVETAYFPLQPLEGAPPWTPVWNLSMVVRTDGSSPVALSSAVRRLAREIDPDVAIADVRTLGQIVDRATADAALAMMLIGIAATAALLLGAVGIYGVIAYVVSQRTHEVGIRMALGASAGLVSRMVLAESMRLVAIGVVIGLAGAVALQRVMEAVLFGTSGLDPLTFLSATGSLLAVSAFASYLPARRAALVDPMIAFRGD